MGIPGEVRGGADGSKARDITGIRCGHDCIRERGGRFLVCVGDLARDMQEAEVVLCFLLCEEGDFEGILAELCPEDVPKGGLNLGPFLWESFRHMSGV